MIRSSAIVWSSGERGQVSSVPGPHFPDCGQGRPTTGGPALGKKQQSPRQQHPLLYCHIPLRPAPAEGTSLGRGQLVGGPRGLSGL